MKPTLQIIVHCANRKSSVVQADLRLRSVPAGELQDRISEWCNRLRSQRGPAIAAENLYAGEYWSVVRKFPKQARNAGFQPKLWVLSAGYGLVPSDALLHSYSATFAGGDQDCVTRFRATDQPRDLLLQQWWNGLCSFSGGEKKESYTLIDLMTKERFSHFLIVASPDYLTAINQDLREALSAIANPDRLLIVTSSSKTISGTLAEHVILSSTRLQTLVGGSCTSLSARVASLILEEAKVWGLEGQSVRKRIAAYGASALPKEYLNRQRIMDGEVREYIASELSGNAQLSCSALLRKLRTSGLACEQGRFKELYWEVHGGEQ